MSTAETFAPYMPRGAASPASVASTLRGAIELLGPNGENWIKDKLRGPGGTFCVVGALEQAAPDYESYAAARDLLKETVGGSADRFNNGASSFAEVKSAVDRTLINMGDAPSPVFIPPSPPLPLPLTF